MTTAFKEWALIVDALGNGRQNIILRKGGITEDGGDFELKTKKFLLFPTQFHQSNELIKEAWKPFLDGSKYQPNPNSVRIEYYVEVADSRIITDWETLMKLHNYHAWTEDVVKERFNRWEKSVSMLIVQVYKLLEPKVIELRPEYSGCKSWIEIKEDIELIGKPVLNPGIH
jgi:hypothetical protein